MSEQPICTVVTETPTMVITRREYATCAVTTFAFRKPLPQLNLRRRPMCHVGALDVARLENAAATDREADDITTEWDRVWGVNS